MSARARLWTATIIAGLVGGYALASDPTPPSPVTRSAPEDSVDQGPSVQIARRVVDSAGAFERHVRTVSSVRPTFDDAESVSGALLTGAAFDARRLGEGAVAYAALVALQEPTFVEGLQRLAADPSGRAAYVERLTAKPDLVLELPGASQAAAMASAALDDMGAGLVRRGRAVKQAAYTVQDQPWSLEPVAQPGERLAKVRAAGADPPRLSENETSQLLASVVARRRGSADGSAAARPTPTVVHGLALAAAAVLGQAGDDRADALSPLLSDVAISACLGRARLNVNQCVAAAGPQYEDVFCAGQHAMIETGECLVTAAGGGRSEGVRVPVARSASAAAVSTSVLVPVAGADHRPPDVDRPAQAPEADLGPDRPD